MRAHNVLAALVAAASLAAVQPAAAQNYSSYHDAHVATQQQCAAQRQNGTVGGAVIGGLLGAVLGSNAAARGHRSDGTLVGGALGAAAGAAIGRSSANRNCRPVDQRAYDHYYGQPYGQQQQYSQYDQYGRGYDDGSGLEGGPYQQQSYGQGDRGGNCRWGEQVTRDPDGYEIRDQVYMCRGRDGVWRAQG
jgi:uncharacterized protein YcfJ